jgi:vancomycin permeability regulator SanA
MALFFGGFSTLNIFVSRFGSSREEDIWWISFKYLPSGVITIVQIAAAVLLVAFALKPAMGRIRRMATIGVCVLYSGFALLNAIEYYHALATGAFTTSLPLPFSLLIIVLFAAIALAALKMHDKAGSLVETLVLILSVVLGILLFPLAQFYTFGRTDYARPADVAVVFGARAYADGRLSWSLRDRVDRAIKLYQDGLAQKLLFTGGVDASGINEPEKMRDYAVAAGVKSADILIDDGGNDTDLSVRNTTDMLHNLDADTVLAVSQFYHLPRIKMAYRSKHLNVLTVPAPSQHPIKGTPVFVARETLAFWAYWFRGAARDLRLPWADTFINRAEAQLHEK